MLLITGSEGMAGWHIIREALEQNLDVHGLWHKKIPAQFEKPGAKTNDVPLHCCDLLDHQAAKDLLDRLRPAAIIHCAALTNVDGCEDDPDHAMEINASVPGVLAGAAAACGARFIQFSTDSVFDGSRPGWLEEDTANPINVYGQSKLEAESLIMAAHPGALALRTNFYGKHPCDDRALAGWILSRLTTGEGVPGFTDVIFSPLWIGHLAQLVLRLATEEKLLGVNGVLNMGGNGAISKYDFARQLAVAGGHDPELVTPSLSTSAPFHAKRPADTTLNVQRASQLLGELPTMDEGIKAFMDDLALRNNEHLCQSIEGNRVQL